VVRHLRNTARDTAYKDPNDNQAQGQEEVRSALLHLALKLPPEVTVLFVARCFHLIQYRRLGLPTTFPQMREIECFNLVVLKS
jgi:hypothetical protein